MKILGVVLLAVGIVLLLFGLNSSQAAPDQIVENITGRFTQTTMLYLIAGIASIVGGGYLTFFGEPR